MKSFLHALATLTRRLRWELAALVLLVPANAFATISSPGSSYGLSSIILIMFWWLTFRIVLSETGYATHGGWKTRPFSANAILLARIFLLVAFVVAAGAVRALTLRHLFHPTGAQWIDHLGIVNISIAIPWLIFIAGVALIALFWRAPLPNSARKAGAAALVIIVVGAIIWTLRTGLDDSYFRSRPDIRRFDTAIQQALPQVKRFIGAEPWGSRMPPTREVALPVLRIPFAFHVENPAPGLHLLDLSHSAAGGTVSVRLYMVAMNTEIVRRLSSTIPVLGFADGSYGTMISFVDKGGFPPRVGPSDLPRLDFLITFDSPLSLPENSDADGASFPPTEIVFFALVPAGGTSVSEAPPSADPEIEDGPVPTPGSIPPPQNVAEFRNAVTALIDSLASGGDPSPAQLSQIAALPPDAIDPILAYHPWPGGVWEEMILPLLIRHATDAHKPTLLTRLATDGRLGGLFIEKGWSTDAIPLLRRRAIERLPLDTASLKLLAEQNDPSLAPHLAALASRVWGIEKLAPILRASAGFDWPGFVALGWRHRKYLNYDRQGWHYARWAAELGDASAFDRLAEEAAAGKKWEITQLKELVAGEHPELIAYLRENIDRMKFDPATRKWGL